MRRLRFIILSCLALLTLAACHSSDEPVPEPARARRTLLVYAVASNNLSSFLQDDLREMTAAAPVVSGLGRDVRLLLYSVAAPNDTEATLKELIKGNDGKWKFETLKSYDRNTYSTDPARMREVFADVPRFAEADRYGLVFWSHGTSWLPNFSDHGAAEGPKRSFGQDKYNGVSDYCDIDELAAAVPDRMFDYIWFDLCYMMGIETAYQLRDKCDWIAGYPTEDWADGMNYDSTLPLLLAPQPDLVGAASSFFNYYNDAGHAVTVTVAKTEPLYRLADAAAAIYAAGSRPLSATGIQNYSRLSGRDRGFYDFGQLSERYLDGVPSEVAAPLLENFKKALQETVVYGACSKVDFNGNPNFDPAAYSGFSSHFPGSASGKTEEYYHSLDWPRAVNP